MKKIFGILAILTLSVMAHGQAANQYKQMGTIVGTTDTITNTGVGYDTIAVHGSYRSGEIVIQVTKSSGTVSPTILTMASVDGLHYFTYGQDTIALSNVTGTTFYHVNLNGRPERSQGTGGNSSANINVPAILPYQYYKVQFTGTGTMKCYQKAWILVRP